jgi:hypothetical protein
MAVSLSPLPKEEGGKRQKPFIEGGGGDKREQMNGKGGEAEKIYDIQVVFRHL